MQCQSELGRTLAEAIYNSSLEAIQLIREQCPTAEAYLPPGQSLMDLAVEAGSLHLVRTFASEAKLVTGLRSDGPTVLFHLKHDINLDILIHLVSVIDTGVQNSAGLVALESFLLHVAAHEEEMEYWPPFNTTKIKLLLPKTEGLNSKSCLSSIWRLFCKQVVESLKVRYDFGINVVLPVFSELVQAGAVASYEVTQNEAGLVPLFEALLGIPQNVFEQDWVETLVENMLDVDSMFDRPLENASSIRLLERAIKYDQRP